MNKQEYKILSHNIRTAIRKRAKMRAETTGTKHTTRSEMHNLFCWCDSLKADKFGKYHYTYSCIGDYDIGLVWEKS